MQDNNSIATGIETPPVRASDAGKRLGDSSVQIGTNGPPTRENAAEILIEHLFANTDARIPGITYAVAYRLAEEFIGGDIVDVYHFDNNSVAFSIADISGKGARAAVHAALIKYGLRAFSSHGLAPERALRSLDRLYLENNNFEQHESFATVFFGLVDPKRKVMSYASAGHEPVIVVHSDRTVEVLAPTAPLIGVFDDQHHLFTQDVVTISAGTLFVATTDGVTESRNAEGEMFGMERFIAAVTRNVDCELKQLIASVIDEAQAFSSGRLVDDMAIIAARFL
ncbi:MAG: serine/threonine-protein phosphatase [Candidatus Eremiobacteraeota bacterium]|nr:serine/threonine-protein phosphatase [Candidatus Eremiobacteraeota bacterium]